MRCCILFFVRTWSVTLLFFDWYLFPNPFRLFLDYVTKVSFLSNLFRNAIWHMEKCYVDNIWDVYNASISVLQHVYNFILISDLCSLGARFLASGRKTVCSCTWLTDFLSLSFPWHARRGLWNRPLPSFFLIISSRTQPCHIIGR